MIRPPGQGLQHGIERLGESALAAILIAKVVSRFGPRGIAGSRLRGAWRSDWAASAATAARWARSRLAVAAANVGRKFKAACKCCAASAEALLLQIDGAEIVVRLGKIGIQGQRLAETQDRGG